MVSAVAGIVEKPRFDDVPSDTASIGRYILKQGIFDVLRDLPAGSGAEIQLADAINIQA
jgi:UTP--glucose-1-phosphate uridylyltransferase